MLADAEARAQYRADVENWGDRVHDASVRMCRWFNDRGAEFGCGKTSAER